jgi:serine kinase of HPr protein (carbohydrate metabolism regulator)
MGRDPAWHQLVNGTSVVIDGQAVLLTGPSGCGKSDLALRLIDQGGQLVADDVSELCVGAAGLLVRFPAAGPAELRGRMEIRGLGILAVRACAAPAPLRLVAALVPPEAIERMPEPVMADYGGFSVVLTKITPFEASAVAKLRLAVTAAAGHIMSPL